MRWIGIELPLFLARPLCIHLHLDIRHPFGFCGATKHYRNFHFKGKMDHFWYSGKSRQSPPYGCSPQRRLEAAAAACVYATCQVRRVNPPLPPGGRQRAHFPTQDSPPRNNGSALFNGGLNPKTFGKGAGIIIEWRCFVDIVSVTTGNTTLKDYWLDNLFSFFNYYSVNRLRCDPFVFLPSKEH